MDDTAHRSPYLVAQLEHMPDENLFNYVKFHLISDALRAFRSREFNILELGCGTRVACRYLSKLGLRFRYFGVDYEPAFRPDYRCDLLHPEKLKGRLPWSPDVLLLLDVLEHLHEDAGVLGEVLEKYSELMTPYTKMIVTLPQMYRLDRFKFSHLHYPEHKIRLTQTEWKTLLAQHFVIEKVRGIGFLSVIPFLPMFSRKYKSDNQWGRLFRYLRGRTMEWPPFKPADLWLSRTIGKIKPFRFFSNDILFVLSKKKT